MLTIILGKAGSGKTARIYERIADAMSTGEKKQILIVPEQFSHGAERELCRRCGDRASLCAEVVSFSRLCSRVLSETGGCPGQPLDGGGRLLAMYLALQAAAPALKVFGRTVRGTDFLESLVDAYGELRSSHVGVETLTDAAGSLGGPLGDKLGDLAAVFAAYAAAIPVGMYDPADRLDVLEKKIAESSFPGCEIYVDGFQDFTAQEKGVLASLLRAGASVTVTLACPSPEGTEPEFELPRQTLQRLTYLAEQAGTAPKIVTLDTRYGNRDLCRLTENLFTPLEQSAVSSTDAIGVLAAPTLTEECELAAAKILELVRSGVRWQEIALASRSWESYASQCVSILEKYGIPVQTTQRRPVLDRPVAAFLTGLVNIHLSGWSHESVFACLRTGLGGITPEETDSLENYVLRWNIRGEALWTRPEGWTREADTETELEEINKLREQFALPVSRLGRELEQADTAREKAEAIWECARALKTDEIVLRRAESLREAGKMQLSAEYVQLWEIFVTALEQLAGVLGETSLTTENFYKLLLLVLSQYDVGTIPAALDRLFVGDLTRIQGQRVRHLLVLGATDASIPAVGRKSGILTEEERDTMVQAGLELSDTGESRLAREMNAVYMALSVPTDGLWLFWPTAGEARPSCVILRAQALFGLTPRLPADGDKTMAEIPCFELAVGAMLPGASPEARAGEAWFQNQAGWRERMAFLRAASALRRGNLSIAAAEKLYPARLRLSASKVDRFYHCRFAYFLQYGLRLKSRKTVGLDAPEAGTFLHFLLENVCAKAREEGGFAAVSDRRLEELTENFAEEYARTRLGGLSDAGARFQYLFARLEREAKRIVLDMAQELRSSDFVPLDFELKFDSTGRGLPPVHVEQDGQRVEVTGSVDRVDGWISDGRLYLRVVDYKTGKKSFSLSDVWYGMSLQMLMYLFTLQQEGKDRYGMEVVPAGVLYSPARDQIVSVRPGAAPEEIQAAREKNLVRTGLILAENGVPDAMDREGSFRLLPVTVQKDGGLVGESLVSSQQLGMLAHHIDLLLAQMARELRRGSIDANPAENGGKLPCTYCDYADICRFREESGDAPRRLQRISAEEVWKNMEEEI